jgi:sugar phosphate isomerase/epimerase
VKFSVFTASTPDWAPAEAAQRLAAQGWHGVEWRITDQEESAEPGFWAGNRATWPLTGLEDSLPAIASVTRDAGLEFSALGGYVRCYDRPNVERMLAATAALGAGRVRVTMPTTQDGRYRDLFAATRRDLEWAVDRAERHDVRVLVELHHRTIAASASAALRLVDGLDPRRVGVIHDVGNLVFEGYEDYAAAFDMLGPYLAHVHVKNAAWRPVGPSSVDGSTAWAEEWAPLPDGQADMAAYFRALHAAGYDAWVTCEDFSTAVPLAQRTRDNLAYLTALEKRTRQPAAGLA